ncbi:hypothetical protein TNCT_515491 [Trichonephila clavata]|uniref:Uncharacterized protein n=1 Tax=Trichonephila clavata TaxID=2740835 RepID=A0A8X6LCH1_TRICU|nr:hypothetical protein TNCT_515491 [Trichonephila clavata]
MNHRQHLPLPNNNQENKKIKIWLKIEQIPLINPSNTLCITRKKQRSAHLFNLLADFLANDLSAAGVSHVVKAPSPYRRGFWFLILMLTAMGMSYMTYRVLQEYLAYPTVMRSKQHASGLLASFLRFPLTPQQRHQRLQQCHKTLHNVSRSPVMMRMITTLECGKNWGQRSILMAQKYVSKVLQPVSISWEITHPTHPFQQKNDLFKPLSSQTLASPPLTFRGD